MDFPTGHKGGGYQESKIPPPVPWQLHPSFYHADDILPSRFESKQKFETQSKIKTKKPPLMTDDGRMA